MRLNFESEYKQMRNLSPHDLSEGLLICIYEVKQTRKSLFVADEGIQPSTFSLGMRCSMLLS